jgi:hypothetical protein
MSRQYQDPRYQYQSPVSNAAQQSERSSASLSTTQHAYAGQPNQHAYPTYLDGSQQPQPLGRSVSHASYADGQVLLPEPHLESQRSSTTRAATYSSSTDTYRGPHQQAGQEPYGHLQSSESPGHHHTYPASSVSSARDYAQPGNHSHPGSYTNANAQQDRSTAGYDEGRHDYDPRTKGPSSRPTAGYFVPPLCRYPGCRSQVFFDRRVGEWREWCGDEHMRAAILNRVEKPCKGCQSLPRRNGFRFCSGEICKYSRGY